MKYYADMEDAYLIDLMRKDNIDTNNQLMAFSNSSLKYFSETSRNTGAYIIFYQGGTIDHGTHVPVPVAQSSAESDYNTACTAELSLNICMVIIHELLIKYPDIVP